MPPAAAFLFAPPTREAEEGVGAIEKGDVGDTVAWERMEEGVAELPDHGVLRWPVPRKFCVGCGCGVDWDA